MKNTARLLQPLVVMMIVSFCSEISAQTIWEQIAKYPGNNPIKQELLSKEIAKAPKDDSLFRARGNAYSKAGKYDLALKDYKKSLALAPKSVSSNNSMAWFYATVADKRFRNPAKSLLYAKRACELSNYDDWSCLDTIASSYASNGNYSMAKTFVRAAILLAPARDKAILKERLEMFGNKRAIVDGYRSAGEVYVINETAQKFSLSTDGWVGADGNYVKQKATWSFPANKSSYIAFDSKRVNAARFGYRLITSSGVSPKDNYIWTSTYDYGNRIIVRISKERLPPVRAVVAKPAIPNATENGVKKAKEYVETANEIAETYKEIKKLFPDKPKPVLDRSRYSSDLILESVSVDADKSRSAHWDGGYGKTRLPDIQVVFVVTRGKNSWTYRSTEKKNTSYGAYGTKMVRIQEGDKISISVHDLDIQSHDEIGSYSKTITKELLKKGSADWTFDKVFSLKLKFEL